MIDFEAESSRSALRELKAPDVEKNLFKYAVWATGSEAKAEDLLREALLQVCDPQDGRPWDSTQGTFKTHMRIVLRDLIKRDRRSARSRREVLTDDDSVAEATGDSADLPDVALHNARELEVCRRLGKELRTRLATSPRALAVFDQQCEGVEEGPELARLCGCTVKQVYRARDLIAYHAELVLHDEEQARLARRASASKRGNLFARRADNPMAPSDNPGAALEKPMAIQNKPGADLENRMTTSDNRGAALESSIARLDGPAAPGEEGST